MCFHEYGKDINRKEHAYCVNCSVLLFRVLTGPGKPGMSWNFIVAFSRTGKSWKKATGPGKFWRSVDSSKKYEVYGRQ